MNTHSISTSILSLGNPWLDFLTSTTSRSTAGSAGSIARKLNNEMEEMCTAHKGRLYFFAVVPVTAPLDTTLSLIPNLSTYRHCRGVVLGYKGLGEGIDDPAFLPVLQAITSAHLPIFLHPHYSLPHDEVFGPCCSDYGQVLPVSLGFTTETTIAMTRLYLAGIFDKLPSLQVILSHGGGMLPFIAGRIEACVANDAVWEGRVADGLARKSIWEVLRENVYLDGIVFDKIALRAVADAVGVDRVMFGTDRPLDPSLREDGLYDTMIKNRDAISECFGEDGKEYEMVMGGNAVRVLNLK